MKNTDDTKVNVNEENSTLELFNEIIGRASLATPGNIIKSPKELYRSAILEAYSVSSELSFGSSDLINLYKASNQNMSDNLIPQEESADSSKCRSVKISYDDNEQKKRSKESYVQQIMKMNSSDKKISTLIVDDDVDSILPVDSIFRKYGCKTEQAMNYFDASCKIKDSRIDIIVLDWRIGKLTGGELIEQCAKDIEDNEYLKNKFIKNPVKIVTYSGDDLSDVKFSKLANQFFRYIGRWDKKNIFSDIEDEAVELMASK